MAPTKRRFSKEEFAKRGEAIFEEEIKPHVNGRDSTEFVVIDIETSAYEIDADPLSACRRLRKRLPEAQVWMRKIGSRYLCHFGGHGLGRKP